MAAPAATEALDDSRELGKGKAVGALPQRASVLDKPYRLEGAEDLMTVPRVGILMGSDSDWPKIEAVGKALDEFGVPWEAHVMSAHRTPGLVHDYVTAAADRGIQVII